MEITDVKLRYVNVEEKIKAIVSVTFDNCFVVHDIKIIAGEQGSFVAMPSRRVSEGRYRDIAHPINSQMRKQIETAVFDTFNRHIESNENIMEASV